ISARARAENRAAQSNLRHALIAAKVMFSDQGSFAGADETATGLVTVEPSLTYVASSVNSSNPKSISVRATVTSWSAAVHAKSGNCYWIKEWANGAVTYGAAQSSPVTC